ncbi:MAG: hypothetical protein PHO07_03345 [Pirellulales bacterium]|jgi:hypothetical protein|nr:hypothetical protein [Thermoguttaceae bacterium]MDD4786183.1 hypothetical protein [Pirellulales bacterium]MDI9444749.1 hypothetical protein [Planctomycetota bacterium]NLZ02586.1 hypothetical protein [Pirellulaceae bacterium]
MYHEGIDVHEPAVRQAQEAGWENGLDNEYTLAVFWPVLEQAGQLTEKARQCELSEQQRQRLERPVDQQGPPVSAEWWHDRGRTDP